ncbi:MAG: pilus assembly protein TadG-related protein [Gemmatimonadales bacterium]|jgi:Flp pilus assembly protein TadG
MISPLSHSRCFSAKKLYRWRLAFLAADERGATGAFVAVGIFMMLGMVALAVDLGVLLGARTDSQRVADAAALAGAASFITLPNDTDRPRQWAIAYASKNTVLGTAATVLPEDVDVLVNEQKVRVRVRNITERGNAIRTIFARALGWDEVNVGTVAAAEAYPAKQTGSCPIPLALPDRWLEGDGDALFTGTPSPDLYVPFEPETFIEGVTTQIAAYGSPGDFTGYYEGNTGDVIEIKTASNKVGDGEEASPCVATESWRCWFQPLATNGEQLPDGTGGNETLWPWIGGCPNGDEAPIEIGDWVYESSAGGDKQSLLHDGGGRPAEEFNFEEVMNFEPDLYWDSQTQCVLQLGNEAAGCVESGIRVRAMPVIDPTTIEASGANLRAQVSGLICVFLEQIGLEPPPYEGEGTVITPDNMQKGNWNLYMRIIPCGGQDADEGEGAIVKALRLVE